MKSKLKTVVRHFLLEMQRVFGLDKQSVLMGQIRATQILNDGKLDTLADAGFSVFSQWDEDGIISWLVDRIKPEEKSFIEFGVEDFREANMRYLLVNRNWKGLVIDGSPKNIEKIKKEKISWAHDFQAIASFITKDNINQLISNAGFKDRVGILSVDIDGVDYWVLEQIDIAADIIIVEYNGSLDPAPLSVPYDPEFVFYDKHYSRTYWGASLTAFRHLLEGRDYVFVGTNRVGTNAFFVRAEHVAKVEPYLSSFATYPTTIRDSRNKDGSLSLKPYEAYKDELKDFSYVNVETGETVSGN